MRVLLGECLPRKLKREIRADIIKTAPEMGWAGTKDGALLRLAEQEFDVSLTDDQNLQHRQNLSRFDSADGVLIAPANDVEDLKPLMPAAHRAIRLIGSREIKYIDA